MPFKSKLKQKQSARRHYLRNRKAVIARARAHKNKHGKKVRDYIRNIKISTACMDCKKKYHFCAMDFDHVRGKKLYQISSTDFHGLSWEKVHAELAKCELVCSNCHRVRTYTRKFGRL